MKNTLKKIVPLPLWQLGSNSYWWWHNRGRHTIGRELDARWRTSQTKLQPYKDRYAGQRCFIIGNGPSLRKMDLSVLKNEVTFGLNRIYLAFDELRFSTSYLVSVNDLVLQQCAAEMISLNIPHFITWRARDYFKNDPEVVFIDSDYTGMENFSGDATGRIFEGFTVTYVALQLAYFMGFNEVILIGVDHNFQTTGPANQAVVSQGDDPNHFSPNYFGKGFKWQLPDLAGSERAYRLARTAYESAGRRVLDATVDGRLTVFSRIDFTSLF